MYQRTHRISVIDAMSLYCHAIYNKNHNCYVTKPRTQSMLGFPPSRVHFYAFMARKNTSLRAMLACFQKGFSGSPKWESGAALVPVTGCWGSQCHGVRSIGRVMWSSVVHPCCASHTVTIAEQLTCVDPVVKPLTNANHTRGTVRTNLLCVCHTLLPLH